MVKKIVGSNTKLEVDGKEIDLKKSIDLERVLSSEEIARISYETNDVETYFTADINQYGRDAYMRRHKNNRIKKKYEKKLLKDLGAL